MDTDPMDTTPILAQPREFAQRLARVERERAELIETVARLRAECNDAQAEAASRKNDQRITNDRAAEAVARMITAERELDAARAEVARLREALDKAAQWIELWAHDVDQFSQRTPDGDVITKDDQLKELSQITAALRGQPAPAQTYPIDDEPCENCVHGKKWHWGGGKCQNACPCEQYKPAPAQDDARDAMIEILDDEPPLIRWQHEADAERNKPAPAGGEARE